jgi:dihydropteroate synthase
MHMQGTPQTMQNDPEYDDVIATVEAFFAERLEAMAAAGLPAEQVALDPGIGFGKTTGHNLALLARLARFTRFQRPLMVGASRKSFLGGKVTERLGSSIACACRAAADGAGIVRVHDVRETAQALRAWEAIDQA